MAAPTGSLSDFLGADLYNALRDYTKCREYHAPMPCYRRSDTEDCLLRPLREEWLKHPRLTPYSEHPLVFALSEAGCNRHRAQMVLMNEGFGMEDIPAVIAAHRNQLSQETALPAPGVGVCNQCKPGTNTYALSSAKYRGSCHRIPIHLTEFSPQSNNVNEVLCVGAGGELKFCGAGEFIAVSHVWAHGWQGTSEDGICLRVLDMLLNIAARFGVEWVWLDVAMISGIPEIRAMSVNAMNLVYTSAKATVVCDRLLLSMQGGNARERAVAIAACDWMTRVWTMQESMLSNNLVIMQNNGSWTAEDLLKSLVYADEGAKHWQSYGAVQTLFAMVNIVTRDPATILERVVLLCRERETTKDVDLARALYPLFALEWPGPNTTLVQGQTRLLEHLGEHAARCAGMFGPIGLPSPWSWAPLSLAGSSGGLSGRGRSVTSGGLVGAWSWKEVRPMRCSSVVSKSGRLSEGHGWRGVLGSVKSPFESGTAAHISDLNSITTSGPSVANDLFRDVRSNMQASWSGTNTHDVRMANLTQGICNFIDFADPDGHYCLSGMVYYREAESYPWTGARLFLLSAADRSSVDPLEDYDLAVVRSSEGGWYEMHRVGAVFAHRVSMSGENMSIQGVLF